MPVHVCYVKWTMNYEVMAEEGEDVLQTDCVQV